MSLSYTVSKILPQFPADTIALDDVASDHITGATSARCRLYCRRRSACRCDEHIGESCRNGWTDRDTSWTWTHVSSGDHVSLDAGPRSPKDRDILGETSACVDVSAIDWRLIYSTYTQCYSQGGGSDAALTTITVSTCCVYRRRVLSQRLREPEVAPHNRQWRHWQLVLVDTCPCTTSQRQSAQSHTHTSRRIFAPGHLPPPKKTTILDICFPD